MRSTMVGFCWSFETTISRGRSTAISSASAWSPVGAVILGRRELAGREVDQRGAEDLVLRAGRDDRHQERRLARLEIAGVGQRARRDDADDLAPDQPLGLPRILDLLADRDAEALLDQSRDVAVGAWKGTPHIGMPLPPASFEREVSVSSRARAATSASS